jgi:hypothetical protein
VPDLPAAPSLADAVPGVEDVAANTPTTELDRGNISNAITDSFMKDVGIDQDQFNVGQQMLSLGIGLSNHIPCHTPHSR